MGEENGYGDATNTSGQGRGFTSDSTFRISGRRVVWGHLELLCSPLLSGRWMQHACNSRPGMERKLLLTHNSLQGFRLHLCRKVHSFELTLGAISLDCLPQTWSPPWSPSVHITVCLGLPGSLLSPLATALEVSLSQLLRKSHFLAHS